IATALHGRQNRHHALLLFIVSRSAHHRDLHSFPTRRSSDLSDETHDPRFADGGHAAQFLDGRVEHVRRAWNFIHVDDADGAGLADRKSTRLNSSHRTISYAVFCLKKKKNAMLANAQHVIELP